MSRTHIYYIQVRLTAADEDKHRGIDVDHFEAERGDYTDELQGVRDDLVERGIETAELCVLDYTDDEEGETVHEEDFDLSEHVDDTSEEEADEALSIRDSELFVTGRDPYRDHMWRVGRYIDDRRSFVNVVWRRTLREVVAWAEDDANFIERDAA